MKKAATLLCALLLAITQLFAQAPQSIPYQAVARDASGHLLADQAIAVRFSIHDNGLMGPVIYSEVHGVTTSSLGLFTVNLGQGTPVSGSFADINWGGGPKFLQVELDPSNGGSFIDMGTTQMLSVPYALYAEKAGSVQLNFNFFFADRDGDGLGDKWNNYYGPVALPHYVADSTDCDDTVPYPGGVFFLYADADGDGYGDLNAAVESCNSSIPGYVDNPADCAPEDAGLPLTYFLDADADGWGGTTSGLFCDEVPDNYVLQGGDCDDEDPTRNPDLGCASCTPESIEWIANNQEFLNEVASNCLMSCGFNLSCFIDCVVSQTPINEECAVCLFDYYSCIFQNCIGSCLNPGPECTACGIESGCYGSFLSCTGLVDGDQDGWFAGADCDDNDASSYPGASDLCDTIDNDCDGAIDEDGETTWFLDEDGDGFGNPNLMTTSCDQPSGFVATGNDCNDSDPLVNPLSGCDDGICSEESAAFIQNNFFTIFQEGMSLIASGNNNPTDIALSLVESFPQIDPDCSLCLGVFMVCTSEECPSCVNDPLGPDCLICIQPSSCASELNTCLFGNGPTDNDGDGFPTPEDCDDNDPNVFPGAGEVCDDGIDNNCNGIVDEGQLWYPDADGDGYGSEESPVESCTPIPGFSAFGGDCDDSQPDINPGAIEFCNGIDDNCNFLVDDVATFYQDSDGDGFGLLGMEFVGCIAPPGYVEQAGDCDDSNPDINPLAEDICGDGIDQDCNGDDGEIAFYFDGDGDGFGTPFDVIVACEEPAPGYITQDGDCDDTDPDINPSTSEVCNGIDDNCDGNVDEGLISLWFFDGDGDGFGTPFNTTYACTPPENYVSQGGDCDDEDPARFPGNNCDICGEASAIFIANNFYNIMFVAADCYANSFGDYNGFVSCMNFYFPQIDLACLPCIYDAQVCAAGFCAFECEQDPGFCFSCSIDNQPQCYQDAMNCLGITDNDFDGAFFPADCDDTNPTVYPYAQDFCDGIDNNCNGVIDEGQTYYLDNDGDGYGNIPTTSCTLVPGISEFSGDCDDSDANVYPGAPELCDLIDNDCDGLVDPSYYWFLDNDLDGYGSNSVFEFSCEQPAGYVLQAGDCDDNDADVNPGAADPCGGGDFNCDGYDNCNDDPDGDGLPSGLEEPYGGNPLSGDTDGDMIFDSEEFGSHTEPTDTDGDGLFNINDPDDDGDGIPTYDEYFDSFFQGSLDYDGDGLVNWLDTDADGDGIDDSIEGREDNNGNGAPDYLDNV